jgi:hypothetical protein
MTVNVDEQSYNLALAIWSLVEQNAASLRAEGASDATVGVVQRDAVARISAEVCYATGGNEDELISEFSEKYSHIRANSELSFRYRGEPSEEDLLADGDVSVLPVNPFGDRRRGPGQLRPGSKDGRYCGNESVFAFARFASRSPQSQVRVNHYRRGWRQQAPYVASCLKADVIQEVSAQNEVLRPYSAFRRVL